MSFDQAMLDLGAVLMIEEPVFKSNRLLGVGFKRIL
jgi:hypothetical protein